MCEVCKDFCAEQDGLENEGSTLSDRGQIISRDSNMAPESPAQNRRAKKEIY